MKVCFEKNRVLFLRNKVDIKKLFFFLAYLSPGEILYDLPADFDSMITVRITSHADPVTGREEGMPILPELLSD